jgi:hypothetical protein
MVKNAESGAAATSPTGERDFVWISHLLVVDGSLAQAQGNQDLQRSIAWSGAVRD